MRERLLFRGMLPAAILITASLMPGAILAENTDPADDGSQWAWAENAGWINAEPLGEEGPGLQVDDFEVGGWLWGENMGWISLSCANTGSCHTVEYGVRNDGAGTLTGWAWAENAGWIDFSPAVAGVFVNITTGELSGHAWGENIGWISFQSEGPHPYVVRSAWNCDPPPQPPPDPPHLSMAKIGPALIELFWDPVEGGTAFDVVHGELNALRQDPNRFRAATLGCINENVTGTGTAFDGTPPPGDGLWFLVRAVNCSAAGSYNTWEPSQPEDRDDGIDASTVDCDRP